MSVTVKDENLGHSLVYQGDVPLSWYVPDQPLDTARTLQLQNQNEEVLHTFLELGDIHTEVSEEQRENYPDLVRLESKVDLALKLLSQIYARDVNLPDLCSLTLGVDCAQWTDIQAPLVNQAIHLEIFLDTKYPRPLVFPALVQSVIKQKDDFNIVAMLEFPGEPVHFSLEKFIFRYHRRCIALSRR
ncbi:MAG TPA: hypothetical protein ENJ07_03255 [Gammaproteobacteria bacterium]|nr:hypothetical protein [Gammaproteobacteria bacterium]